MIRRICTLFFLYTVTSFGSTLSCLDSAKTLIDLKNPFKINTTEASQRGWTYAYDKNKKQWIVGRTQLSKGIEEAYLKGEFENQKLPSIKLFHDYLLKTSFTHLSEDRIGIALHLDPKNRSTEVYQLIDQSRVLKLKNTHKLSRCQKTIFNDYLEFALKGYQKRMRIPEEILNKARSISLSMQNRSYLLAKTKEPYIVKMNGSLRILQDATPLPLADEVLPYTPGFSLPEHFSFEGGAIAVTAEGNNELLPLEQMNQIRLNRAENETWVEIGRFFIDKESDEPINENTVAILSNFIRSQKKISRIVIEVEEARSRLFQKLGFKIENKLVRFDGKDDYILSITPEEFLNSTQTNTSLPNEFLTASRRAFLAQSETEGFPFKKGETTLVGGSLSDSSLYLQKLSLALEDSNLTQKQKEAYSLFLLSIYLERSTGTKPSLELVKDFNRAILDHFSEFKQDTELYFKHFYKNQEWSEIAKVFFEQGFRKWKLKQNLDSLEVYRINPKNYNKVEDFLYKNHDIGFTLWGDPGIKQFLKYFFDLEYRNRNTYQIFIKTVEEMKIKKLQIHLENEAF